MSEVPEGWTAVPLQQLLLRIDAGQNIKCDERPPRNGELGLVKISAVTWGTFNEEASKTLPPGSTPDERNRICQGDLLISRANTIELVGASVIVGPFDKRLYLSDKVLRLVVHEPAKRWINYALKTPQLRQAIQEASTGNQLSMRNIPQEKLRALNIPIAPEPEQQRIADQLDMLFARVRACNDRFDAIPALLKRFRQAVLEAACSGTLTVDWRAASGNQQPWPTLRLANVISEMRNGLSAKPTDAPPGTKILRISAVRPGVLDTSDHRYLDVIDAVAASASLVRGDVLFTRYNGTREFVGACALVRQDMPEFVYPDKLIRVRVRPELVLPEFFALACNCSDARSQVEAFIKSSAGQKGISGGDLKSIKLRVPELKEQAEVVLRVEALFKLADRIEARYSAARAQAQRLTPLVLAKAFRGELVAQDPLDEPASAMLARLAKQPAVRKPPDGEQLPAVPKASPAQAPSVDWNTLPDGAWANLAPADAASQAVVQGVHLAAVLKAFGAPVPAMHVRLAALLSLQPRSLPATLDKALLRQWRRLVGAEADPLPATVVRLTPRTDASWRQAVASLRARGDLIENAQAGTWAPGASLARSQTAGWPDGRARWLVHMLRKQDTARLLQAMVPVDQAFVHGQAA